MAAINEAAERGEGPGRSTSRRPSAGRCPRLHRRHVQKPVEDAADSLTRLWLTHQGAGHRELPDSRKPTYEAIQDMAREPELSPSRSRPTSGLTRRHGPEPAADREEARARHRRRRLPTRAEDGEEPLGADDDQARAEPRHPSRAGTGTRPLPVSTRCALHTSPVTPGDPCSPISSSCTQSTAS